MISMDKKYRTRDGREVVLYCVDAPSDWPVHGRIIDAHATSVCAWTADGSFSLQFCTTRVADSRVADAKALQGNIRAMTLLHGRGGRVLHYRAVQRQWEDACKSAGVEDAHLHDLRAKSLTDAKRQGYNAQALGGHTSAAMTARYIRLRETPMVDGPSFKRGQG